MAKKPSVTDSANVETINGAGGETHQQAAGAESALTTDQGLVIADNQNSLKIGDRGPVLLEDFILREKITNFDHERIPERVVHARGFGAHGFFQPYESHAKLTKAAFLQDPDLQTPVFVRFSTVAGSAGSFDLARDVRGFAVKFYTSEGVYDLVGNNIPVFFIQDAMKFPDLIHAVKPEPDRGFPQAASAHDTFWDFVSLTPESMHMLLWVMSDRAIPRSYRMMEGFGVHTFRMVNVDDKSTFVKFHWRPKLGTFSVIWEEAVKINGADPDFHRRDLWESIEQGSFPEFEFCVQVFDQKTADKLDFDVLDPTKLIPEEIIPLVPLGKMVLNRNVDNFFAETEQVAFCPSHLVPGIEFSNDPLLQGRLFSYLDTQLKRLGSPNFHELPINASKSPVQNHQRDGHMRTTVPRGRVAYEPSSLDAAAPREHRERGFSSLPVAESGDKLRIRPESFADHYSQARLFWTSMTVPERSHIVGAFAFELGKVQTVAIRQRMLAHLAIVADELAERVAGALGMAIDGASITPAQAPRDLEPSPALSQLAKAPPAIAGKKFGILVTDGSNERIVAALKKAAKAGEANVQVIAPRIGGVVGKGDKPIAADHALAGAPSVLFDAVVLAPSAAGVDELLKQAAAIDWVRDAFAHLKIIGFSEESLPLLAAAGVDPEEDAGMVAVSGKDVEAFLEAAKAHRIWGREPKLRTP